MRRSGVKSATDFFGKAAPIFAVLKDTDYVRSLSDYFTFGPSLIFYFLGPC